MATGSTRRQVGRNLLDGHFRSRTEFDHVRPRFAHGPTAKPHLKSRCWRCHQAKTKRDRRAASSNLRNPDPGASNEAETFAFRMATSTGGVCLQGSVEGTSF